MTVWPAEPDRIPKWEPGNFGPKYGRQHHLKCLCEICTATYHSHNASRRCECEGCYWTFQATEDIRRSENEGMGKMSAINVCDRCSTMMTGNALGSIRVNINNTDRPEVLELCPGCVNDFLVWSKETPTTARPKVYKEPFQVVSDDTVTKMDYEEVVKLARKAIEMMAKSDTGE